MPSPNFTLCLYPPTPVDALDAPPPRADSSATSPTLKRSLSSAESTSIKCSSPRKSHHHHHHHHHHLPSTTPQSACRSPQQLRRRRQTTLDTLRRRRSTTRQFPSMSSQSGSPTFPPHMPSFMSVFGDRSQKHAHAHAPPHYSHSNISSPEIIDSAISSGDVSNPSPLNPAFNIFHQTRRSTSTFNSDVSSDSSPTTTVSTLDCSSMTDPSPAVSPESPLSLPSLPGYEHMRLRRAETDNVVQTDSHAVFDFSRPGTPAKKPRNLKNLAVNTSQAYSLGKAIATAQFPLGGERPRELTVTGRTSEPVSPSFIKPPSPPRRKKQIALGLTISTPSLNNSKLPALTIPPTPSLKRPHSLRHFQSSPSLPLITPSMGPEGGMRLPPIRSRPPPQGFAEVLNEDDEEPEPNFDLPQSREDKPEAYPDGPIRIYESGIDLFLEPSAEVASQYDVVMNVASEVGNPFHAHRACPSLPSAAPGLSSTFGVPSKESQLNTSSPTTPKATPVVTEMPPAIAVWQPPRLANQPEYIHIPWEHNTDIVPDLHKLVKVIDERVVQGKKVLVHCQCGVSRSASLIVAYGLYKNPDLSVQEAYDAVKKRSKWIGPNMNLIMQLQEFKAGLQKNKQLKSVFGFPRNHASAMSPSMPSVASTSSPGSPRSAPSPQRANSTGDIQLSARSGDMPPPGFYDPSFRRSWDSPHYDISPQFQGMTHSPFVDAKGHVFPVLTPVIPDSQSPVPPVPSVPHMEAISRSASLRSNKSRREVRHFAEPKQLATREGIPKLSLTTLDTSARAPPDPEPMSEPMPGPMPDMFSPIKSTFDFAMRDAPPWRDGTADHHPYMETLASPRSELFGMTGFDRKGSPSDGYGIMSPTGTTLPPNPWDVRRSPSDQALRSTRTLERERLQTPQPHHFDGRFSTPPPLTDASSPSPGSVSETSSPQPPSTMHRRTPPPPRALDAKFSSPYLAEQRRLHQMQTELEARLPHHSPGVQGSDEDALMSPRAGEFTGNPFRFEVGDVHGAGGHATEEQRTGAVVGMHAEVKQVLDPRSPAQYGISPITRNIFDVL